MKIVVVFGRRLLLTGKGHKGISVGTEARYTLISMLATEVYEKVKILVAVELGLLHFIYVNDTSEKHCWLGTKAISSHTRN